MMFPLTPMMPAPQGGAPDSAAGTAHSSAPVAFGLMFGLGTMKENSGETDLIPMNEDTENIDGNGDETATEDQSERPLVLAEEGPAPVQPNTQKQQATFLESAFATIALESKTVAEKRSAEQVAPQANRAAQIPVSGPKAGQEIALPEKAQPNVTKTVERDTGSQLPVSAPTAAHPKTANPIPPTAPDATRPMEPQRVMREGLPSKDGALRDRPVQESDKRMEAPPMRQPQAMVPVQIASMREYVMPTSVNGEEVAAIARRAEPAPQPILPQIGAAMAVAAGRAAPPGPALAPYLAATMSTDAERVTPPADVPLGQGFSDVQTGQSRTSVPEPIQMPAPTPQLAKTVSHQMAVAISQSAGGTTEIILSPEELGKVRMVMSAQETGITVLIQAERPETNDLLRRHLETLSQEFKNMGYSSASFTFAQDQQAQSEKRPEPNVERNTAVEDSPEVIRPMGIGSSAGLDLRI